MTDKQAQALNNAREGRDRIKAILDADGNAFIQAFGGCALKLSEKLIARAERKYGLN